MKNLNVYISHSIRGKFGNLATLQQMKRNNKRAFRFAKWLRVNFPKIKFYVPGELDVLLHAAGINPIDVVDELLILDCAIIENCNLILVFIPDGYISVGMLREINYCKEHKKPYIPIPPIFCKNKSRLYRELTRIFKEIK